MKRRYLFVILFAMILLPFKVSASGSFGLSASSITMYPGESKSITISSSDSVGKLNISSSNSSVVAVSAGSIFIDTVGASKTFTITSGSVGSATISVVGTENYASYSDMVSLEGMRRTITVNVVERPAAPTPTPQPSNPTPSGPADTRSTNTKLSKLTVNGNNLSNVNNVFTIEVGNYVEKVDIAAVAADSKAKVTGTGSKDIKVGENNFNVVVTAERGNSTTYTVKVIRKEFNTLSDLDEVLKLGKDAEVQFSDKDKISRDILDKIISNKRKITLTKYDSEKKKTLYSFILDGNNIKASGEFNPNISLVVENNTMEEAVNYAAGLYLDFSNCGSIPKGIILKYFVGDIYSDNDKLNLYSYDGSKVVHLKENIEVVDGYVSFNVEDAITHLISKTNVVNAEVKKEGIDIWMITTIALGVLVFILLIALIAKKPKKEKVEEVKVEAKKEENTVVVEAPKVTEPVENVVTTTINVSDVVEKTKEVTNDVPEIVETLPVEEKKEEVLDK